MRLPSGEPISPGCTVLIRLYLAIEPTAGAVVYRTAINSNAKPADVLASLTVGTVKNRTIT